MARDRDLPSYDEVAARMRRAGYELDGRGAWALTQQPGAPRSVLAIVADLRAQAEQPENEHARELLHRLATRYLNGEHGR